MAIKAPGGSTRFQTNSKNAIMYLYNLPRVRRKAIRALHKTTGLDFQQLRKLSKAFSPLPELEEEDAVQDLVEIIEKHLVSTPRFSSQSNGAAGD